MTSHMCYLEYSVFLNDSGADIHTMYYLLNTDSSQESYLALSCHHKLVL